MRQRTASISLLPFAAKALKYFLLVLCGCTVAYVLSTVLELTLLSRLLVMFLEAVLSRIFVVILCLGAIAVITESVKS